MRLTTLIASATLAALVVSASNITETQNKSKRGVVEQTQVYGEQIGYKPVGLYQEPVVAAAVIPQAGNVYSNTPKPLSYVNTHVKPVYEADPGKVNAAQVIYGYHHPQDTTVPSPQLQNVPIHYSQPIIYTAHPSPNNAPLNLYHGNNYPADTVIAPVHHNTAINHSPPQVQQHPSPYTAPKYIYQNPKLIYNPALHSVTHQPIVSNNYQHPLPAYTKPHQLLPISNTHKPLNKLPIIPSTYSFQQLHARQPWKPIESPVKIDTHEKLNAQKKKVKNDEEDEENEKSNVKDDSNEEFDSNEHYEEDDDDDDDRKSYRSSRYHNEDDDDSHERYEEDDEDEDNHRGSSKYHRLKPYKYHKTEYKPYKRYQSKDNYRYKESYKSKSKNGKPVKGYYKSYEEKEPKSVYKTNKYSKSGGIKPKIDNFEGTQSENVPVVHNKQIFQEKWFVSKTHDMTQ